MVVAKKPFSIRIEQIHQDRFRALATVMNKDNAEFLKELVNEAESNLNENQRIAFEALIKCWMEDQG